MHDTRYLPNTAIHPSFISPLPWSWGQPRAVYVENMDIEQQAQK
jgi:hypothetical protein